MRLDVMREAHPFDEVEDNERFRTLRLRVEHVRHGGMVDRSESVHFAPKPSSGRRIRGGVDELESRHLPLGVDHLVDVARASAPQDIGDDVRADPRTRPV